MLICLDIYIIMVKFYIFKTLFFRCFSYLYLKVNIGCILYKFGYTLGYVVTILVHCLCECILAYLLIFVVLFLTVVLVSIILNYWEYVLVFINILKNNYSSVIYNNFIKYLKLFANKFCLNLFPLKIKIKLFFNLKFSFQQYNININIKIYKSGKDRKLSK